MGSEFAWQNDNVKRRAELGAGNSTGVSTAPHATGAVVTRPTADGGLSGRFESCPSGPGTANMTVDYVSKTIELLRELLPGG